MSPRRAASWSWVFVLAAIAVSACNVGGSDSGALSGTGYPAPEGDLGRPGAPLADGFVVAAGSALMGPLLVQDVDEQDQPAAWTAYLVVHGDPLAVWDAYLAQVASLGLVSAGVDRHGLGCDAYSTGLSCGNSLHLDPVGLERWVEMRLARLRDDPRDRYLITLSTIGLGGAPPTPSRWRSDRFREHPGGPLSGVPTPSPAPAIGDLLGPGTTVPTEEFTLLEGSRLVAQVGPGGATGGLEVLLAVEPGVAPADVTSRYEAQCEQAVGGSITYATEIDYGGSTQRKTTRATGGVGECTVTLNDSDHGVDYILLGRFND